MRLYECSGTTGRFLLAMLLFLQPDGMLDPEPPPRTLGPGHLELSDSPGFCVGPLKKKKTQSKPLRWGRRAHGLPCGTIMDLFPS